MEPGTGLKPDGPGAVNRDRGQAREPTGARTRPMNHPAPTPALRSATRMRHPSPRLQPGFFAMRAARTHRRPRRTSSRTPSAQLCRTRPHATTVSPRRTHREAPPARHRRPFQSHPALPAPARQTEARATRRTARRQNPSTRAPPAAPVPHRPPQSTGHSCTGEPPCAVPHATPLQRPSSRSTPSQQRLPRAGKQPRCGVPLRLRSIHAPQHPPVRPFPFTKKSPNVCR